MRILHALSQCPEATGSGIYVRAMVREAFHAGHENFLPAGIPADDQPQLDCLTGDQSSFVHFETGSLPFPVVGMSDVMPYPSRRFSDLTAAELEVYEKCFAVLGELPGSYCRLVDLPRLKSLDTPFPEDEASFEGRLAGAIRDQIEAVRQEPRMDPALLAPILEAYSWTRVFERVEEVYFRALNRSLIF